MIFPNSAPITFKMARRERYQLHEQTQSAPYCGTWCPRSSRLPGRSYAGRERSSAEPGPTHYGCEEKQGVEVSFLQLICPQKRQPGGPVMTAFCRNNNFSGQVIQGSFRKVMKSDWATTAAWFSTTWRKVWSKRKVNLRPRKTEVESPPGWITTSENGQGWQSQGEPRQTVDGGRQTRGQSWGFLKVTNSLPLIGCICCSVEQEWMP